jgi:hypothetical protein
MSELQRICDSIVKSREYKKDSTKKTILFNKCLNVENQMFLVYMKTGKSNKNNFPFESLGNVLFISQTETQKIARMFMNSGWNPSVHVILTRKKFEKISYIGKTINY